MAVEFHIAEEQVTRLVAGMFQDSQRQTCVAPVGEVYGQWADPVPAESDWTFDGSAAQLRLAVDVGVSTRDEVVAAVDQPAGAQVTPLRLTIVLRVHHQGACIRRGCGVRSGARSRSTGRRRVDDVEIR